MPGFEFNDSARAILEEAAEDARRRRHEYVGTEHILSALVLDNSSIVATVLRELRVDPEVVQQLLDKAVKNGKSDMSASTVPFTSRARAVLEFSMSEAREMGHNYVGAEHLLAGLLHEEKGLGAQILVHAGASLEAAREVILRESGRKAVTSGSRGLPEGIASIAIELRATDGTISRHEFTNLPAASRFLASQ